MSLIGGEGTLSFTNNHEARKEQLKTRWSVVMMNDIVQVNLCLCFKFEFPCSETIVFDISKEEEGS